MPKRKDKLLNKIRDKIAAKILLLQTGIEKCFDNTLARVCDFVFEHAKWRNMLGFLFLFYVCGSFVCAHYAYSISVYTLVFLSLGSIASVSVCAEKEFINKSKLVSGGIAGNDSSYNHNTKISSLVVNAQNQWSISGKLLFKSSGTLLFFGVIGCLLLKERPPTGVFILYLCMYGFSVGFSMIGYHQYHSLLGFISDLANEYEPSKKVIRWMTKEQTAWLVELAKLYDFMSAAFFTLALLYIIACCGFCFHPAFGVLSKGGTGLAILLLVFWGKILYELTAKYIYRLYIGKKNLTILANRIKDSHLSQVQSLFGKELRKPEDGTGYNLYLQLRSLELIPAKSTITSMIRGISSAASFVVTLYSLYTIFQSLQTKLV